MNVLHLRFLQQVSTVALLAAGFAAVSAPASAFTLTNGPGDGTVSVGVDSLGSFGSSIGGTGTSDASFDPSGVGGPAGTTFESGIAIGFGGGRTYMTSGGIGSTNGGTVGDAISGSSTSATSSFSFGGLTIALTQTLSAVFTLGVQTGSELLQIYAITNSSDGTLDFDIVRYIDGDLLFDGSLTDGGGRLVSGANEILFEIDSATGTAVDTTFVGITAVGGTAPATGRIEVDSFSGLRARINAGTLPDDIISGDSADADEFIDAGGGYDVTLALRNVFTLLGGESSTYTTRTIFGQGAPDDVVVDPEPTIPGPAPLSLLGLGLVALGVMRRKRTS